MIDDRPDLPIYVEPIGWPKRLLLFGVIFFLAVFVSAVLMLQVVREFEDSGADLSGVYGILCGQAQGGRLDFSRLEDGQRRPVDQWVLCIDEEGEAKPHRLGFWLAGAPLAIPLAIPLGLWVARTGRGPKGRVGVPVTLGLAPVNSKERSFALMLVTVSVFVLVLSIVSIWSAFRPDDFGGALMSYVGCGADLTLDAVGRYRRLACLAPSGAEVPAASGNVTLRLTVAIALLFLVPAWWRIARMRTVVRHLVRYDPVPPEQR